MIKLTRSSEIGIWENAWEVLAEKIRKINLDHKKALLLLSGGSAVNLYRDLAEYIKKSQFISDNMAVGQVDERFQPAYQETINNKQKTESIDISSINYENIRKNGLVDALTNKNIPFYRVPQKGSLAEAAESYNKTLGNLFKKDDYKMAVLGIGEDGHTAGLLPGYEKEWKVNRYVVGYNNQGEFPQRITITPKAIKELDYALVVVSRENKREALRSAIKAENITRTNSYPAVLIQKIKEVDIITSFNFES